MNKKLFVAADIHGYFTALKKALDDAGFDEKNEDHVFVSCGDLFDRGDENTLVYEFVKGLPRKILVRGNHEDMLYQTLMRGNISETDRWNETDVTVAQILGEDAVDANGCFDVSAHAEKIHDLKEFIDSMVNYLESDKYVFTHGWLPIAFEGRRPYIAHTWRDASEAEWAEARLLEWQQLYSVGALVDGKTIVCGHRPARLAHMFDSLREPDCSEPFYGRGMIAIDAGTVRSGRVNVLVVEVSGL